MVHSIYLPFVLLYIPIPIFYRMVRDFITSFGNVDSFDIMGRAMKIVEEAEVVATDLYGPGLSPRQQQQLMFEKVLFAWYETLLHRDLRNTHYAFVIYL